MFEKSNLLILSNLKSDLKKNKSALICSFIVGFVMGSIPFIHKSIENFRIQKLIQEEKKIQMQNKEIICKKEESDYKKFLNLGFPKTAIEKFNICMKEQ